MGRQLRGSVVGRFHGLMKCRVLYVSLLALWLIFLNECSSIARADESTLERYSSVDGKEIYTRFCVHCHGEEGIPPENMLRLLTPPPSDLTLEQYRYGNSLEAVKRSIRDGIGSNMLRFKERLTEEQFEAVSQYVFSLKKPQKLSGLEEINR